MKAFCLTLRQSPERKAFAVEQFARHGLNVTMFHGLHAPTMGIQAIYKSYRHSIQSLGCFLSHWMLWTAMLTHVGDEFLVFEDDAVLCDGFADVLDRFRRDLPTDWDYAFVGHMKIDDKPCERITDRVAKLSYPYPFGTHAYLVTRRGLEKLLETNQTLTNAVDVQIQRTALPHLNVYASTPSLASQRESIKVEEWDIDYTDVAERFRDLDAMHGWCTAEKAAEMYLAASKAPTSLFVEIGVFGGRSLVPLAMAAKERDGLAVGIDAWSTPVALEGVSGEHAEWWGKIDLEDMRKSCVEALAARELSQWVNLIRGRSDVCNFGPGEIGVLHIDGNHFEDSALRDAKRFLQWMAPGGTIFLDDVSWRQDGHYTVREALQFLLEQGCTLLKFVDDCAVFQC